MSHQPETKKEAKAFKANFNLKMTFGNRDFKDDMSNSLFLLNNVRKPVAAVVHFSEPQEPLFPLTDAKAAHCPEFPPKKEEIYGKIS